MNVKTMFLNSNIDKTIYSAAKKICVKRPKELVCKLKKSIYQLKQVSRQWYFKFCQTIISFNFDMNLINDCICYKLCGSKYTFSVLYVDGILLACNNIDLLYEAKRFLAKNFDMKILVTPLLY